MQVPLLVVKHDPCASDVGPTHAIVGTALVTRNHASSASAPQEGKVGAAVGDAVGEVVGTAVGAVGAAVGSGVGMKVGTAVGARDICKKYAYQMISDSCH